MKLYSVNLEDSIFFHEKFAIHDATAVPTNDHGISNESNYQSFCHCIPFLACKGMAMYFEDGANGDLVITSANQTHFAKSFFKK